MMVATQRVAHQPPRAHHKNCQNANDLVREAVGCMGGLDGGGHVENSLIVLGDFVTSRRSYLEPSVFSMHVRY
jgi:hypothetical protein